MFTLFGTVLGYFQNMILMATMFSFFSLFMEALRCFLKIADDNGTCSAVDIAPAVIRSLHISKQFLPDPLSMGNNMLEMNVNWTDCDGICLEFFSFYHSTDIKEHKNHFKLCLPLGHPPYPAPYKIVPEILFACSWE